MINYLAISSFVLVRFLMRFDFLIVIAKTSIGHVEILFTENFMVLSIVSQPSVTLLLILIHLILRFTHFHGEGEDRAFTLTLRRNTDLTSLTLDNVFTYCESNSDAFLVTFFSPLNF